MSNAEGLKQQMDQFRDDFTQLREQLGRVVVGQTDVIEQSITALVAGGHILLEGPPGLGKTLLVRTLSDAIDLDFRRIQFTPDLMPSDVIGTYVCWKNMDDGSSNSNKARCSPIFCSRTRSIVRLPKRNRPYSKVLRKAPSP